MHEIIDIAPEARGKSGHRGAGGYGLGVMFLAFSSPQFVIPPVVVRPVITPLLYSLRFCCKSKFVTVQRLSLFLFLLYASFNSS
jgi:hypothetical protein